MNDFLVQYNGAKRAIAQAREALDKAASLDEAKNIEAGAETLEALARAFAKQANDPELIEQAIDLRKRAQIKAGEFLLKMEKHNGGARNRFDQAIVDKAKEMRAAGHTYKKISEALNISLARAEVFSKQFFDRTGSRTPSTFEELGISRKQAADWQHSAALSKEEQEAVIQAAKDKAVGRTVKMKTVNPKPKAPRKDAIPPGKMDAIGQDYASGKTRRQVATEHGVGENTVTRAAEILEARQQGAQEAAVDPETLPKTAQEKLAVATRQMQRQAQAELEQLKNRLRAEFDDIVKAEIKKRIDELVLPSFRDRDDQYRRVIKSRKGIMSRAEYRLIAAALHPDQSFSKEKLNEAFRTFTKYQLVLCAEPEIPAEACPPVPRTFEEAVRMRDEERRKAAGRSPIPDSLKSQEGLKPNGARST